MAGAAAGEQRRLAGLDEISIAWIAGFLDADGSFSLSRITDRRIDRKRHRATMRCSQKGSRAPVDKLHALLGGTVICDGRDSWSWALSHPALIATVIARLLPHLARKRPEAELMLAYCRGPGRAHPPSRISDPLWRERDTFVDRAREMRAARRV